jgi:hypothetical protein
VTGAVAIVFATIVISAASSVGRDAGAALLIGLADAIAAVVIRAARTGDARANAAVRRAVANETVTTVGVLRAGFAGRGARAALMVRVADE